jgi:hypothetical protein
MSQFTFLQGEWAAVSEAAAKAEAAVYADPRTVCFYARRALELAVSCFSRRRGGRSTRPASGRERQRGDRNRAALAVARKLVSFLPARDRRQTPFAVEPIVQ